MAGRSELPSGRPSSLRRTELRLGEPEPPAKKRIIDVAVLVEPVQLARVSGYRAMCASRCRPPASLVKVVLARYGRPSRAAFPVAGAKADAGMASYGLSAGLGGSASRTRSTQECSPRLFTRAEEHTQRFRLGLRDFTMPHTADSWALSPGTSLTQECVQCSLLVLRGYATSEESN